MKIVFYGVPFESRDKVLDILERGLHKLGVLYGMNDVWREQLLAALEAAEFKGQSVDAVANWTGSRIGKVSL